MRKYIFLYFSLCLSISCERITGELSGESSYNEPFTINYSKSLGGNSETTYSKANDTLFVSVRGGSHSLRFCYENPIQINSLCGNLNPLTDTTHWVNIQDLAQINGDWIFENRIWTSIIPLSQFENTLTGEFKFYFYNPEKASQLTNQLTINE